MTATAAGGAWLGVSGGGRLHDGHLPWWQGSFAAGAAGRRAEASSTLVG
ncbi:hypothetical protein ACYTFC_19430 [Streptomyces globosus]